MTNRLQMEADKVLAQLATARHVVEAVRAGDTSAARSLRTLCRNIAYEGSVLCIDCDELLLRATAAAEEVAEETS